MVNKGGSGLAILKSAIVPFGLWATQRKLRKRKTRKNIRKIGNTVGNVFNSTTRTVAKGVTKSVRRVSKGVRKVSKGVRKSVRRVSKGVRKGVKRASKSVSKTFKLNKRSKRRRRR